MNETLTLSVNTTDITFSVNEGSPLTPIDLKKFIQNPSNEPLSFQAELANGDPLPNGITCSTEGRLSGTPTIGTGKELPYDILIITKTDTSEPLIFDASLQILSAATTENATVYTAKEGEETLDEAAFKDYWEFVLEQLDLPDLETLLTRKFTKNDLYYLLSRFSTFNVWNADDLRLAVDGKPIDLEGTSPNFQAYDFEVALVATPKDLYATNRTLSDSIQTAKAMIQEAYKRKWNVELTGYDKMIKAAQKEAIRLNELKQGYEMQVRVI